MTCLFLSNIWCQNVTVPINNYGSNATKDIVSTSCPFDRKCDHIFNNLSSERTGNYQDLGTWFPHNKTQKIMFPTVIFLPYAFICPFVNEFCMSWLLGYFLCVFRTVANFRRIPSWCLVKRSVTASIAILDVVTGTTSWSRVTRLVAEPKDQ